MYKELFKKVFYIISQPGKAWVELSAGEEKEDDFLTRFVYPLIGVITLAAFLGILFTRKEFDVQLALKASIRSLVVAFGGFYLGAYVLNEIWHGIFRQEKDSRLWQRFVGYSSSLMFMLNIVQALLPEFFFLRIFILYTFYIIWEGAEPYMHIGVNDKFRFVLIVTLAVIALPFLIEKLLFVLMPGLQF